MTKPVLGGVSCVVLGLMAAGCVQPNPPTAYTTEDVFGMPKPTYALGRQIEGHVVRLNPMAQMITLSQGHGGGEVTFPVESQGVAALRTLRPGATVTLTCRAIDSPSLQARADLRQAAPAGAPVAVASPVTVVERAPAGEPAPGPPPTTPVEVAVASPLTVTAAAPPAPEAATAHVAEAAPTSSALAPAVGPLGGGAQAGLHGLLASCPSVVRIETQ